MERDIQLGIINVAVVNAETNAGTPVAMRVLLEKLHAVELIYRMGMCVGKTGLFHHAR